MLALGSFLLAAIAVPPSVPADPVPAPSADQTVASSDPVIRLWLSSGHEFREGERAKVEVESAYDGYLLVLNYDSEGRLRVLFPVGPGDDNSIVGGRRYEVRGRGDRESFVVGRSGDGVVFAAVSPDPFDFRDYQVGGNWDYDRLYIDDRSSDPEADISQLLQRMTTDRGFDYDLLDYRVYDVGGYYRTVGWYPRPYGYYDDYYCDWWYRPSLFGCRGYWPGYRGYFGFSYYSPYRYGHWGSYGYWYPRYRTPYYRNLPVVVGRPRGYTIVRRGNQGSRVGRPGGFSSGTIGRGIGERGRDRTPYDGRTRARRPQPSDDNRPNIRPGRDGSPSVPSVDRPRARPANPRPSSERRPNINQSPDRGRVETDRPRARPANPRPRTESRPSAEGRPSNESRPNVDRSNDRGRVETSRPRSSESRPSTSSRPSSSSSTSRPSSSSSSSSRARPSSRSRPSNFSSAPARSSSAGRETSRPSVSRPSVRPSRPSVGRPSSSSRPSASRSAPRASRPSASRPAPRSSPPSASRPAPRSSRPSASRPSSRSSGPSVSRSAPNASRPAPSRGSSRSRPRKP